MRQVLWLSLAVLMVQRAGRAEVADSSSAGFTVKVVQQIAASPDEVYRKFLRIGEWWNPEHTFSGNSHNLSIEDKPAGCFCEKPASGGGARHMEVVYLQPGKAMTLSGALGPLQSLAATGSMVIQFAAAEGGTKLAVSYSVAGYTPAGMNTWAGPVDGVITEQFTRLKRAIEKGDPGAK